jgi:hypothetical protein
VRTALAPGTLLGKGLPDAPDCNLDLTLTCQEQQDATCWQLPVDAAHLHDQDINTWQYTE